MKRVVPSSIATFALCSLLSWTSPAAAQAAAPNTLTDAEKAAGWKLLFDGKTTNGWHGFGRDKVVGWDIVNGELIALGQGGDHANDIVTNDEYQNFELLVDWKVSPKANSGIFYGRLSMRSGTHNFCWHG